MILDNLKFRKLDNGYTVKYHCAESGDPESRRFGGEKYCRSVAELQDAVEQLIEQYMPPELE